MLVCMLVAKIQESWCSFKHSQPLPTRPQTIAVKKKKEKKFKNSFGGCIAGGAYVLCIYTHAR